MNALQLEGAPPGAFVVTILLENSLGQRLVATFRSDKAAQLRGRIPDAARKQFLDHQTMNDPDRLDRIARFNAGEALPIKRRPLPAVLTIGITRDAWNVNLLELYLREVRTMPAPFSRGPVFEIEPDVLIGSIAPDLPAMRTGRWPEGCIPTLLNRGCIFGAGGGALLSWQIARVLNAGGNGGNGGGAGPTAAQVGGAGGDALLVEVPVDIDNAGGEIWGAGGGGGGGGVSVSGGATHGGGAGGGGAGSTPGNGGIGGTAAGGGVNGGNGSAGTTTSGGGGGTSNGPGVGGAGGGPGVAGTAGTNGTNQVGAAGGAAGAAVNGDSLVTWIALGDIKGARVG